MTNLFPRTTVGGISMPRMIMGINWLFGFSHTGPAADAGIREKYQQPKDFFPVFKAYLDRGVDAIMGPISSNELGMAAIKYAEDKLGKQIIIVDTPIINVDDSADARREARASVRKSRESGATFSLVFHSAVEQLVNKRFSGLDGEELSEDDLENVAGGFAISATVIAIGSCCAAAFSVGSMVNNLTDRRW